MVLSKREKLIVYVAGAVLGALALDWVIVEPLLAARSDAAGRVEAARAELERSQGLFENSRRVNRRWSDMVRGQLRQNASAAESQVLNGMRDWAQEAGLALSSLKQERSEKEKEFNKLTFHATGTGNMNSVARFLYAIQTAPIAVRVTDVKLNSRKEGTDDLSIDIAIATIHLAPGQATGLSSSTREVER